MMITMTEPNHSAHDPPRPRFRISIREMMFTVGLVFATVIIILAILYTSLLLDTLARLPWF
jgi:hypothetical protein